MKNQTLSLIWLVIIGVSVVTALRYSAALDKNQEANLTSQQNYESTNELASARSEVASTNDIHILSEELSQTKEQIKQLQTDLANVPDSTAANYESLLSQAQQQTRAEFYARYRDYATAMKELEQTRSSLGTRSAEVRIMMNSGLIDV